MGLDIRLQMSSKSRRAMRYTCRCLASLLEVQAAISWPTLLSGKGALQHLKFHKHQIHLDIASLCLKFGQKQTTTHNGQRYYRPFLSLLSNELVHISGPQPYLLIMLPCQAYLGEYVLNGLCLAIWINL